MCACPGTDIGVWPLFRKLGFTAKPIVESKAPWDHCCRIVDLVVLKGVVLRSPLNKRVWKKLFEQRMEQNNKRSNSHPKQFKHLPFVKCDMKRHVEAMFGNIICPKTVHRSLFTPCAGRVGHRRAEARLWLSWSKPYFGLVFGRGEIEPDGGWQLGQGVFCTLAALLVRSGAKKMNS